MQNAIVTEFTSDQIYAAHDIAKTIMKQISITTKMACGAREYRVNGLDNPGFETKRGIQFRVGAGSKRQYIKVVLEPNDTYTVICYRLKRVTNEHVDIEQFNDIYCDQLSEIIYHMVNK